MESPCFDLILANPPYIPSGGVSGLHKYGDGGMRGEEVGSQGGFHSILSRRRKAARGVHRSTVSLGQWRHGEARVLDVLIHLS